MHRSNAWLIFLAGGAGIGLWATFACAVQHELMYAIVGWLLSLANVRLCIHEWNLPKRDKDA